jgi:hypothetical protein
MARKPTLTVDALTALGAEKLARLVFDEVGRNAAFKKLVAAALAGTKGPQTVATLIDRRLLALERARGFVGWDKAKIFAADLGATVQTIVDELGEAAPALAAERLLRFIATHATVYERSDDSSGRIQAAYQAAIEAVAPVVARMVEDERRRLPDQIMSMLAGDTHDYVSLIVQASAHSIPADALKAWDACLCAAQTTIGPVGDGPRNYEHESRMRRLIAIRQSIADARGDLDGFIALEEAKPSSSRNAIEVAERLMAAGRHRQALAWVRGPQRRTVAFMTSADIADGTPARDFGSMTRTRLEARLLDALGDRNGAQGVRWAAFEATLDPDNLREHVQRLDDFAEFDVLDQAFALVAGSRQHYRALDFFLAWPRLDLAADLVVRHHARWSGRHYATLAPAAQALEADHPVAATVLYRSLLDEILASGRSPAYGHGARYLARLDDLVGRFEAASTVAIDTPATYRAGLLKAHGRKSGFWALVRTGK